MMPPGLSTTLMSTCLPAATSTLVLPEPTALPARNAMTLMVSLPVCLLMEADGDVDRQAHLLRRRRRAQRVDGDEAAAADGELIDVGQMRARGLDMERDTGAGDAAAHVLRTAAADERRGAGERQRCQAAQNVTPG